MKQSVSLLKFKAKVYTLECQTIARLPAESSKQLSSRGQVATEMLINGQAYMRVVEPDGDWGHWIRVDEEMQEKSGIKAGDVMEVELRQTKAWPEPLVPTDLQSALRAAPEKVQTKWRDITPMARWEWVRWIGATANASTRSVRIEKTISKLNGSHRRPCCFNLASCTDMSLSKSGRLIGIV